MWGKALRAGCAKRDPERGPSTYSLAVALPSVKDWKTCAAWAARHGAVHRRHGCTREELLPRPLDVRIREGREVIQDLYLAGKKSEAIAAVPDELVRAVSLVGPRGYVKERLAAFAEAGTTTLLLQPLSGDRAETLRYVEELRELLP